MSTVNPRYGEEYYRDEMKIEGEMFAWVSRLRGQKIQPYVLETDSVFEFGVGNGVALSHIQCAEKYGYDINPFALTEAEQRGIKVLTSLEGIESKFDVAFSHHCLEHLTNPTECLLTLKRILKAGGMLLIFVPYDEQRRYRRHIKSDTNHHLFSWTPHTLSNLIEDCGFTVESVGLELFGYDRIAARTSLMLGAGELGMRVLRRLAHMIRREREIRIVAKK